MSAPLSREETAQDAGRALAFLADLIRRDVIPADRALAMLRGDQSACDLLDDYADVLADDLPETDPYMRTVRAHVVALLLAEMSQP